MKILMVVPRFPRSSGVPAEPYNLSRAKALREVGCDVLMVAVVGLTPPLSLFFPSVQVRSIAAYWKTQRAVVRAEHYGGLEILHPSWFWAPKRLCWKWEASFLHAFAGRTIKHAVEAFQPDLVVTSWIHPFGSYARFLKKRFDVSVFAIAEGNDILIDPDRFSGWPAIRKTLEKYCDVVFCVSGEMMHDVRQKRNLRNTALVRNGYDSDLFYYKASRKRTETSSVDIVSVGNQDYVKGHDILLRAMEHLPKHYRLLLIGAGALTGAYQRYVRSKEDLSGRVTFLGEIPHDRIAECLWECDIFCMPSRSEGLPAAPLEAMACGLPVVATSVGGLKELVLDGFNGFLCDPESAVELARSIETAANTTWQKGSIAAWAGERYSWKRWAREVVNIYERGEPVKFEQDES